MAVIFDDDIYTELIKHLGLTEQHKFHLDKINFELLMEYKDFKLNHPIDKINFVNVCRFGYLNIAKFFYEIDNINIHKYDDRVFRWSCQNGHLEVAKWLYQLGEVNIHVYNDGSFRMSCENGHIEVAKWLYQLGGVDIHAKNNSAFNNKFKIIIDWLNTL